MIPQLNNGKLLSFYQTILCYITTLKIATSDCLLCVSNVEGIYPRFTYEETEG